MGAAPRTSGRDHPRMGREKAADTCVYYSVTGSPPRGRGKVAFSSSDSAFSGITPAWAGKRSGQTACTSTRPDHPRMGGEKGTVKLMVVAPWGSPPHRRGKVLATIGHNLNTGITPALAGKSSSRWSDTPPRRDHPRVGGEKCCPEVCTIWLMGSPPRRRGKASRCPPLRPVVGITPAWAGKSS